MTRPLRVLTVGALLLAACGGGDDQAGTLTVSEVASATKEASTFRFATDVDFASDRQGTPYRGEVDAQGRASLVMAGAGPLRGSEMIWTADLIYTRPPDLGGSRSRDWCTYEPSFQDGAGVSPVDTLSKLQAGGQALQRVGEESVRDEPTVHYAVEGAEPPMDIWVDEEDRLRRLVWTHGEPVQTDTVEIYDFGAPIEIAVPEGTSPCRIPGDDDAEAPRRVTR